MEESQVLQYVQAAAAALRLPLTPERAAAVAQHLGRSAAIARTLEAAPLAPHEELAEIYRPAPFPREDAE
jgi:hypothetical protein